MTLFAMLLGPVLPACGQAGAAGLPAPAPIDFAHLRRPGIRVLPDGAAQAHLILWSRSLYGRSDFGANRRRVVAWLAALDAALARRAS